MELALVYLVFVLFDVNFHLVDFSLVIFRLSFQIDFILVVPSVAPPGVQVKHRIALDYIVVTWQAIHEDQANGRFVGYKIKYVLSKVSGKDAVKSNNNIKNIVVDKYTFRYKITGLQPYTDYSVSVCGYTMAGNGPSSKPIMAGKSLTFFQMDGKFYCHGNCSQEIRSTMPHRKHQKYLCSQEIPSIRSQPTTFSLIYHKYNVLPPKP